MLEALFDVEQQEFEKIKLLYEKERNDDIERITTQLQKINDIYDLCRFNEDTEEDRYINSSSDEEYEKDNYRGGRKTKKNRNTI